MNGGGVSTAAIWGTVGRDESGGNGGVCEIYYIPWWKKGEGRCAIPATTLTARCCEGQMWKHKREI